MFIGLLCFFFLLTFLPLNQNVKLTFHAELCHFVNYSHFICALLYIRFPKNESDFLYFLFIKTKLEQGIRELDIKYGKVCHKLSYNIVNSRQDAEECVNDAYLGAWNAIPPAKPNPLLTYICKIVRNISLKIYYRKEAAKRNSTYTIAMEEMEACIADPNTVEAEIEARELARIIESFLDTLTVENRVIFMRRYWFSDSCKDIAEFVGLSEKNISVRLTRIRQKMKNYLAEREVFV